MLSILILFLLSFSGSVLSATPARLGLPNGKHIVAGYFPSWSENFWLANSSSPTRLKAIPEYVNTLFVSFAKPNLMYVKNSYDISNTGLQFTYGGDGLLASMNVLKQKKISVILAIGGEPYWNDVLIGLNDSIEFNIDYNQIKDLVDDFGFDGIDWDYQPGGSSAPLAKEFHLQKYIEFITKSREVMPKSSNYVISASPAGNGALGGQINDDPASPYKYEYASSQVSDRKNFVAFSHVGADPLSLFYFPSTGHFIPVMKAVQSMLDLVAYKGYNVGGSTDRTIMYDSYAHYASMYGFAIVVTVHVADEAWGPYYIFNNSNVADLAQHILASNRPADGIMQKTLYVAPEGESKDNNGFKFAKLEDLILNGGKTKAEAIAEAEKLVLPEILIVPTIPPTKAPEPTEPFKPSQAPAVRIGLPQGKHIVAGYFPSWYENWDIDVSAPTRLRDVPEYVNTLFIAFAKPNLRYVKNSYDISKTGLQFTYGAEGIFASVHKLKEKKMSVILAIGGSPYWNDALNALNESESYDIEYNQIKDLVDDFGFDGIDWDYQPGGNMGPLAEPFHVEKYTEFIKKSREVMPKSSNYVISASPGGNGALGGQTINDPASPYKYEYASSQVSDRKNFVAFAQVGADPLSLFYLTNSGHFIPVMQAVQSMLDLVAYKGYNVGGSTDRTIMYDSYVHYASMYGFAIVAGVQVDDEAWGPYYIFNNSNVADLAKHILASNRPADGIIQKELYVATFGPSKDNNGFRFAKLEDLILNGGKTKAEAISEAVDIIVPHSANYTSGKAKAPKAIPFGPDVCGKPTWTPNIIRETMEVYYDGFVWKNTFWTNGAPNDTYGENEHPWVKVSICPDAGIYSTVTLYCLQVPYVAGLAYPGHKVVYYNNSVWKSKWYADGLPGSIPAWGKVKDCDPATEKVTLYSESLNEEDRVMYANAAVKDLTHIPSDGTQSPTTPHPTKEEKKTPGPTAEEKKTPAPTTQPLTEAPVPTTLDPARDYCSVKAWLYTVTYAKGSKVYYRGYIWNKKWVTRAGDAPEVETAQSSGWERKELCGDESEASGEMAITLYCGALAWDSLKIYRTPGNKVYHNNKVYTNKYWAGAGQEPGKTAWGPWGETEDCDSSNSANVVLKKVSEMTEEEKQMYGNAGANSDMEDSKASGSIVPVVIPILVVLTIVLAAAGFYYHRRQKGKAALENLQKFESEMGKFNKPLASPLVVS